MTAVSLFVCVLLLLICLESDGCPSHAFSKQHISGSGLVSCSATVGTSCLNCSTDLGNKTLKYYHKTWLLKLLKEKTEKYKDWKIHCSCSALRSVRKCLTLCCNTQDSASKDWETYAEVLTLRISQAKTWMLQWSCFFWLQGCSHDVISPPHLGSSTGWNS